MSRGSLFVISGPSGTGKGTVCEKLLEREEIFLSVSTTTRDKRANEVDGVTYNYTTTENFQTTALRKRPLRICSRAGKM